MYMNARDCVLEHSPRGVQRVRDDVLGSSGAVVLARQTLEHSVCGRGMAATCVQAAFDSSKMYIETTHQL